MLRVVLFILGGILILSGCTTTQKGAATGAAVGAGIGAIVGHQSGETAEGALVGAAAGGLAGALVGEQMNTQFCPSCGKQYPSDVQYCPDDGSELRPIKK